MNAYKNFAYYYDLLMDEVDYDGWVDYLEEIFKASGISISTILEIGCGTGNIANRLAERGYKVIASDISDDMLTLAQDKAIEMGVKVNYVHQDMRDIRLNNPVDCIICVCDGINYILSNDDLEKVFKGVHRNLNSNGLFVFDINSHYKISTVIGNNTFGYSGEEICYIWENYYNPKTRICDYYLTFFKRIEGDMYHRFEETHRQKAYLIQEMEKQLIKCGFKVEGVYQTFTFEKPGEKSERINFTARRDFV
jgi:ubiquinone/menaquinone biosynthesis C-methylase UbiE